MTLKYIFLVLSIIVIFFVFYKQYTAGQIHLENMTNQNDICGTSPTYDNITKLPLREYCIKASFNSAYNSTEVSNTVLETRLKEGYRFIDLNVFSASGDVYVGFSQDNAPQIGSSTLKLSDALTTISTVAFSPTTKFDSSMAEINTYPVFVHIRVYRKFDSKTDIISEVKKVINGVDGNPPSYAGNYYRENGKPIQISGCTSLKDIMGKMIISMDILNILEIYAPIDKQSASTISNEVISYVDSFVNVLTGGSTIPAFYRYSDETIVYRTNKLGLGENKLNNMYGTNVDYMYISFPHPDDTIDDNNINSTKIIQPDIATFLLYRSIQLTPMRVYLGDDVNGNLKTYIQMFNTIGSPFAPMIKVYQILSTSATPHDIKPALYQSEIVNISMYIVVVLLVILCFYMWFRNSRIDTELKSLQKFTRNMIDGSVVEFSPKVPDEQTEKKPGFFSKFNPFKSKTPGN